jgi:hypothetical protein
MKLRLKGLRFDTTEEIQPESQTVLDTLTENDFQEAFQKWWRRRDQCLTAGGNYFEGDGGRDRPYGEFYDFSASVRNILHTPAYILANTRPVLLNVRY